MDQKKRTSAHNEYDRLAKKHKPETGARRRKAKLPEPSGSKAARAHSRATAAVFDGAGLSPRTAVPAGEAKIDEILRGGQQQTAKQKKKFIPVDVPFFMLVSACSASA